MASWSPLRVPNARGFISIVRAASPAPRARGPIDALGHLASRLLTERGPRPGTAADSGLEKRLHQLLGRRTSAAARPHTSDRDSWRRRKLRTDR